MRLLGVLAGLCGLALVVPAHAGTDPVAEACRQIAGKLASVSLPECHRDGLRAREAVSVNGFPMLVEEFPPLAARRPLGRVLVVGGIHGDELASVSVVFKWMTTLGQHHSGLFHWRIAPLLNPDGLLQRRSQRMNANGVDLNRNFPTPDWTAQSHHYWVQRTGRNPRRYPGAAPMSEPETRWLVDEVTQFRPDVIVAVHAPYGVLDFDGALPAPERLGGLYLNLLGTYPGSLGNFGMRQGIPVITIELPSAGIMPSAAEISDIWVDLVAWLRRNLPDSAAGLARGDQAGPS